MDIRFYPYLQKFPQNLRDVPDKFTPFSRRKRFIAHYMNESEFIRKHTQISVDFDERRKDKLMAKGWSFANIPVSPHDKPAVLEFAEGYGNDCTMVLPDLLAEGYKISLSWVDKQNAFCASMSYTDKCSRNQDTTLSAWSDDLGEAIFILAYKHLAIAKSGDWSDYAIDNAWG